jgi:hypothetical protein
MKMYRARKIEKKIYCYSFGSGRRRPFSLIFSTTADFVTSKWNFHTWKIIRICEKKYTKNPIDLSFCGLFDRLYRSSNYILLFSCVRSRFCSSSFFLSKPSSIFAINMVMRQETKEFFHLILNNYSFMVLIIFILTYNNLKTLLKII